ncbi:MAG: class I SAM-dependent methyltransferase [Synechococcus sp.]|nr:class I SAM-dependent methyltransferase [Synechococcus sp.]
MSHTLDLFRQQWATYRTVVDHDLMEHAALSRATAAELQRWLAARGPGAPAPELVDLGCGDLGQLAPLLRQLPLGGYTGLDLTASVLPLAAARLEPVPYPTHWLCGDLLGWALGDLPADSNPAPVALIHTSYAVHHLSEADKLRWLEGCRRRIAPGGLLLWADVFRPPGEELEAYRQRYSTRIREGWPQLSALQREQVIEHLSGNDLPADGAAIAEAAAAAGWRWRWVWQGEHRAEALAALEPA